MNYIPTLLCDFYKLSHRLMYPYGTECVYSTWTPRASRMEGVSHVVAFGFQAFLYKLNDIFDRSFFSRPKQEVVEEYVRVIANTLGIQIGFKTDHIEELHDLGYLPLEIRALDEGTLTPIRVPMLTIENTEPRFFWLTNYIETFASCELWQASTSATIAYEYRKMLNAFAMETVGNTDFVAYQGHDFSMRGMSSLESAINSGMGHLLSFVGTDTIPAISAASFYYNGGDLDLEKGLIGTSIPASEHSIQCAYGDDMKYFDMLINNIHRHGFVSIVSDGYDFWDVIGRVIPAFKESILSRQGKVVIRPDSGDPVKIVCGDEDAPAGTLEHKGAIEALWDIFGGTTTDKGYRLLDSHIGLIYGDSITLERCKAICEQLKNKGFASINAVFGIGSYTYQHVTRDTFGFALKSTFAVINGEEKQIFKDPKTDSGIKKSQKGRVAVIEQDGDLKFIDGLGRADTIEGDLLKVIYRDGEIVSDKKFSDIREVLWTNRI